MTKLWKNDVLWNAVGSLVYALASMVLAFAVIRLAGARDGGIFGFGFSTLGQQMFIVAYFGIRPFQITDMKPEYRFGDYLRTRRLTSGLALLGVMVFLGLMCLSGQYDSRRAAILLFCPAGKFWTAMRMFMSPSCSARGFSIAADSRSASGRCFRYACCC